MHSCKLVLDNARLKVLKEPLYKTDESATIRKERHWL